MIKLLALDLSLSSTGYAVIQWEDGCATVLEVGHIDNKRKGRMKWSHGKRLMNIYEELSFVINSYPDIELVVREKGVSRFNRSTQVLFRVVGVVDLLLEEYGLQPSKEITISETKKVITGDGKAEKEAVATAVQQYLTENVTFTNDDESDAVAVGVAYCIKEELK